MSAHRADFAKRSGLQSFASHCDQAPIARTYPEIASPLDCLRQERAGIGPCGSHHSIAVTFINEMTNSHIKRLICGLDE
jgi:hypothetical protein